MFVIPGRFRKNNGMDFRYLFIVSSAVGGCWSRRRISQGDIIYRRLIWWNDNARDDPTRHLLLIGNETIPFVRLLKKTKEFAFFSAVRFMFLKVLPIYCKVDLFDSLNSFVTCLKQFCSISLFLVTLGYSCGRL